MNQVWEYKVETFRLLPREEYEDRLDKLGIEGWEVCGVQGESVILKRRLPKSPEQELLEHYL